MTVFDDLSQTYLIAGLCLGEHIDGFVDSYHGPESLKQQAREVSPAAALDRLDAAIDVLEPSHRHAYLLAQARSMRMAERVSRGEQVDYREQVAESFDIEPFWTDEADFEASHYTLDQILPGSGSLDERRQRYRSQFEIDDERALSLAEALLVHLRARANAALPLPDGEGVELRLVSGQPWSGYNWYLGNLKSRIEINTDLPVRLNDLPDLLAHEAYPGHHTEHSIREHIQLGQHGHGEFAIALLTTPQAVVSEGIATNALDVIVPPQEQAEWLREHVYSPAGMAIDVEGDLAISRAGKALAAVVCNAALLLHDRSGSVDDAVEYVMRYGLRTENEARRSVEFLTHPLFRTYIYTYISGFELVSNYLQSRGDGQAAFQTLLTEHWTPGRLRGTDRHRSTDDERLPV